MKTQDLIDSAGVLGPFDDPLPAQYEKQLARMTAMVNERMSSREDIHDLLGGASLALMKDNHANHGRFIASILKNFHAGVLVETILWVFRTYKSRGISSAYWAAQMNAWHEVIEEVLSPEDANGILPLYQWIQVNIPLFDKLAMEALPQQHSKH